MTERSYYWDGTVTGDASLAPYSDDEYSDILSLLMTYDRTLEGVIPTAHTSYSGGLLVSNPAGTTIRVASGAALVDGKLYTSDANVDHTPAGDGTWKVILRKSWAGQTVRSAITTSALTQTDATTWEILIGTVVVAGGVVTSVTDNRRFIGAAGGGMYLLEEQTLTAASASITFDNIPNTFRSLQLRWYARDDYSATAVFASDLYLTFNGDGGANYDYVQHAVKEAGGSEFWSEDASADYILIGEIPSDYLVVTANVFGTGIVDIIGYAQSTGYKTVQGISVDPASGTEMYHTKNFGSWKDTDPITSITIVPQWGNFKVGSMFTLYGIS